MSIGQAEKGESMSEEMNTSELRANRKGGGLAEAAQSDKVIIHHSARERKSGFFKIEREDKADAKGNKRI